MCRDGREGFSLGKGLCWYPLSRAMNLCDCRGLRLTAQLSCQKRGEVLFLLTTLGSQAGGGCTVSQGWIWPLPNRAASPMHISPTEIL